MSGLRRGVVLVWATLALWPLAAHAQGLIANASFAEGLRGWETWLDTSAPNPPVAIDHAVFRGADMAALAMRAETGKRGLLLQTALPRDPAVSRYRLTLWVRCRDLGPDWIIRAALLGAKGKTTIKWVQNSHFAPRLATMDWTKWTLDGIVPPEATHLALCLGLWTDDKLKDNPPAGGGTVWFDDLSLEPVGAPAPAPAVAPAAPTPPGLELQRLFPVGQRGLFTPGQPVQLMLLGHNAEGAAATGEVKVRLVDYAGRPAGEKSFPLAAEAGKPVRLTLELPPPERRGWFRVETTLTQYGKTTVGPQTSLCVIEPVTRRDDYFAADINGQEAELVPAMQMIGVSARKVGGTIRWVPQDQRGDLVKYWQNEIATGRTAVYWKSDLTLIGNIFIGGEFMDAQWKSVVEDRRRRGLFPYPDEFFQQFGDFIEAEATVLKPRVKYWVLSEEIDGTIGVPDLLSGSPSAEIMRYVLMCRIAYQRLKQVNPDCQVIGLAVSSDFNQTPRYPLVRRLLPDLRAYTDIIGPDLYTDSWNWIVQPSRGPEAGEMRGKLLDTLALQASLGKPAVTTISERGYGMALHLPPTDPLEKLQAELTARSLIIGKSLPQVLFYALHMFCGSGGWWESTGKVSTDANPQIDLGLWRSWYGKGGPVWYRPRSAVAAYATVARMLAGSTACTEVLPEQGIYGYVFTCPDRTVAALWTTDAQACAMQLDLPAPATSTDLMGNATPLESGATQVTLDGSPLFLATSAKPEALAEALRQAAFPARSSLKAEARLADLNTAVVELVNQSGRPAAVQVQSGKIAGAVPAQTSLAGEVPANGRLSLAVPLKQTQLDRLGELQATVRAGAQALPVIADLSARAVPTAPAGVRVDGDLSEWNKQPALVLDSADALGPSREVMARGQWTGPDDLSVRAWLGWDERNLVLAARVRDDVHVQRQSGDKLWMDDCLQFALDMANDALSPATVGHAGYDGNDFNFGAALTEGGPSLYGYVERGATETQGPRAYPVAVKRTDSETCYELALPWQALQVKPRPGLAFAFSFIVFDLDSPGEQQASYWLGLTPGIAGGQDPSQYRTFVLTR